MKVKEVKQAYKNLETAECPFTNKLMFEKGYMQKNGGYITRAKNCGIKRKDITQYWHLMTYCDSVDGEKTFGKNIVCGELLFWMAEVAGGDKNMLENLEEQTGFDTDNRKKWNNIIQEKCWPIIEQFVNNEIK